MLTHGVVLFETIICLTFNLNFMKTMNFFASTLLISSMLVSTAFASEGDKSGSELKASENSVREQLSSALSDVASTNKGVVFIYFSASSEKGFELLNVAGEDKNLNDQVKKTLNPASVSIPSGLDGSYVVKIVFTDKYEIKTAVKATDVLRNEVADALSGVGVNESALVKLILSVKNNTVTVDNVEGASRSLASTIESTLNTGKFNIPVELTGKYEVKVQF
jgi:hypothetical protein